MDILCVKVITWVIFLVFMVDVFASAIDCTHHEFLEDTKTLKIALFLTFWFVVAGLFWFIRDVVASQIISEWDGDWTVQQLKAVAILWIAHWIALIVGACVSAVFDNYDKDIF